MQHDMPRHPRTGLAAVGIVAGRPVWPVAGGAENGENGEQGQQTGGQGGLLDEESNQGGQSENEQGQNEQGQTGQQEVPDLNAIVQRVTEALEGRFDSIADRRVNAILREVRGQQGQQQNQGGGSGQGEQQGQGQQTHQSTDTSAQVREGRLVYREFVADEIRFLGNEERDLASSLAAPLLAQRIAAGEDPDRAGQAVAREVANQVKGLRKHYEEKTVAALRRRGALPADNQQRSGQPLPGGAAPGGQQAAGYQRGAEKANAMFAGRQPAST